jgi:hypothetical protein
MNTYTYVGFTGYWPVGTAAVVCATSRLKAAQTLHKELEKIGLKQTVDPDKFIQVSTNLPQVRILLDGNY